MNIIQSLIELARRQKDIPKDVDSRSSEDLIIALERARSNRLTFEGVRVVSRLYKAIQ